MSYKNTQTRLKTLIIGIGNPLCCDDITGIKAANILYNRVKDIASVSLYEAVGRRFDLLVTIIDYEKVIIIDSIQTQTGKIGQLYQIDYQNPSTTINPYFHSMGIFDQIKIGREMNLPLPNKISIYGIEVSDPFTFGERLTEGLEEAIVEAVEVIAKTEFGVE